MVILDENFKEEISQLWDQYQINNGLDCEENSGLQRKPSFCFSAFGFNKVDGCVNNLRSSIIAYLDDPKNSEELLKALEKVNFHLKNNNNNNKSVIRLVHNNSLNLLAMIGASLPKSLSEQISIFDSLVSYCISIKDDFINIVWQKYSVCPSPNKKNDFSRKVDLIVVHLAERDKIEVLKNECYGHFIKNKFFQNISKIINLFLINLSKYHNNPEIRAQDVFAFLHRLSQLASDIRFLVEPWLTENNPPEPDTMKLINKLQILTFESNYSPQTYFPLYILIKQLLFSEDLELLQYSQEGIINIIELSKGSKIIAGWLLQSDISNTVFLRLFSYFNQCCCNDQFDSHFFNNILSTGSGKLELSGNFARFSDHLRFVINLVGSIKDFRVQESFANSFQHQLIDLIEEQYNFDSPLSYRAFVMLGYIFLIIIALDIEFYEIIDSQIDNNNSYFIRLFQNLLMEPENGKLEFEIQNSLRIFTFKFLRTILSIPDYSISFGKSTFFEFTERTIELDDTDKTNRMLDYVRLKASVLSKFSSVIIHPETLTKYIHFLKQTMDIYNSRKYLTPSNLGDYLKLDTSKPFTKFLIDSLSRYYFNGFQTNLQLSELLIMLLTQSVTSVDGYLSHVKSIHGKEDDVSRIVELLYDICLTIIEDPEFINLEDAALINSLEKKDKKIQVNIADLRKNFDLFCSMYLELFTALKAKNFLMNYLISNEDSTRCIERCSTRHTKY
ncbi:hypothetical protein DASC09_062420 [Saccharomycopsis crataegensis]|uniref:Uncharacterized protein n=1 Tax=Saccharomycopsis crataegensis TaxID=43959 RepID=A0AAV5QVM7_9ASCO|nr:hypothetical protein DASC09_062420 [Saccharomycopsis crataegensis]